MKFLKKLFLVSTLLSFSCATFGAMNNKPKKEPKVLEFKKFITSKKYRGIRRFCKKFLGMNDEDAFEFWKQNNTVNNNGNRDNQDQNDSN